MASARVATSERKRPRTDEVTVTVPGFFTPRIDMHRCSASMTTRTPRGRQHLVDGVGDLGGHPLLDLQATGVAIDQPGQLRKTGDAAVLGRDIRHVRLTQERHQVVLAQRSERDVTHHDHFVVLGGKGDLEMPRRVVVQAREQLLVHVGHPARGVEQAVAIDVLTDGDSVSRPPPLPRVLRLPPPDPPHGLVFTSPHRRIRRRGGPLADYGNAPPHRARNRPRTTRECGSRRSAGPIPPAARRP